MFKDSLQALIDYYNKNNEKDNTDTITARKLLLPHIQSFLDLIETNIDAPDIWVSVELFVYDT